jgi:predicted small secreted protein
MRLPLMIVLALAFVLAGCNTVQGLGKDISKAGDKIEEAAKKK